jgi:hypothetical protein
MMEDEKDNVRKECVSRLELDAKTIKYFIIKSLDKSSRVRIEVYKSLTR